MAYIGFTVGDRAHNIFEPKLKEEIRKVTEEREIQICLNICQFTPQG